MKRPYIRSRSTKHSLRGLSLIEVMVAMVLGLVVVLGTVGIMMNNRQNARITESMSELQENARLGFELIARDVRAARDTGCGATGVDTSELYPAPVAWWQQWEPVRGFDGDTETAAVAFGTATGTRVEGTHALQLQGTADGWPLRNIAPTTSIVTTAAGHPFAINDLVVLCDLENFAANLRNVTGVSASTVSITPETDFSSGQLAHFQAVTWFVGNNGRAADGGRSLYRVRYTRGGVVVTEEVLPGISDMLIRFRLDGGADFINSVTAAQRPNLTALEITLTARTTQDRVTIEMDNRLERTLTYVIALRNLSS